MLDGVGSRFHTNFQHPVDAVVDQGQAEQTPPERPGNRDIQAVRQQVNAVHEPDGEDAEPCETEDEKNPREPARAEGRRSLAPCRERVGMDAEADSFSGGEELFAQRKARAKVGHSCLSGKDGFRRSGMQQPVRQSRLAGAGAGGAEELEQSAGAAIGDQKRVATPAGALAAGASYLVIGRPITQAPDPVAATQAILEEMASVPARS